MLHDEFGILHIVFLASCHTMSRATGFGVGNITTRKKLHACRDIRKRRMSMNPEVQKESKQWRKINSVQ